MSKGYTRNPTYSGSMQSIKCRHASSCTKLFNPGIKEKDVAAEIEYAMRKKGSDGVAFETIIASGTSSAFPHGSCSDRTIKEGDLVVVDLEQPTNFTTQT